MLNRREFAAVTAGVLATACGPEPPKPNILFLMPDQWRAMDLGIMGNPDVHTPHMDALAADGALLKNVSANCPVCCPARGTLLTGRYAHQHTVAVNDAPLPDSEVTIAEIAKENGYRTGFIGKWHLEGGKRMPGFVKPERRQGFDFWAANICSHNYWNMHYFRDTPEPIPIEGYSAAVFTQETISFIEEDKEIPFLAYVQWGPPHNPYVAPPEYMNMYDPDLLTMRENWNGEVQLRNNRTIGSRNDLAGYYAAITFLDDQVGMIVEALKNSGQYENTLIFITSDHGDMLGSQGTLLKRKPWAESLQVPGIVHFPGNVPKGQELDFPFSHVDVVPTLLGMAGLPQHESIAGLDLSAHLMTADQNEQSGLSAPESVYLQSYTPTEQSEFPHWRGVRTDRYTYARHEDRAWVLYDNEQDPFQLENLADKPEHAELQAQLDMMTTEWFERTGDDWSERSDMPYN